LKNPFLSGWVTKAVSPGDKQISNVLQFRIAQIHIGQVLVHQQWAGKYLHSRLGDFLIYPLIYSIRINPDHHMVVVTHDSISTQIDGKY
jgi:hypothetical protein